MATSLNARWEFDRSGAQAHTGTYLRGMQTWLGHLLEAKLLVKDMAEGIAFAVWW